MAQQRWTIISEDGDDSRDFWEISAGDIPGTGKRWRVAKKTLRAGLSQGVDTVEVDNGRLKCILLPTRGMGIWRAWVDGHELGWRSPVRGPVHPCFVPIAEPSGNGWLSGFDELMCRCGLESNGAPDFDEHDRIRYPLHGRISNLPAYRVEVIVDDVAGTISVHGSVEESRYHFQKLRLHTSYLTRFGAASIGWHDEVENFGGCGAGMQMLYHTNIGRPLLGGGSRAIVPISQFANGDATAAKDALASWDTYTEPQPGFAQEVYYFRLLGDDNGDTRALLKTSDNTSAVQLKFNTRQLPCFTLWRNFVAEGDGYVTGIEPGTNYPNPRSFEEAAGRVIRLPPGGKWQADVVLEWLHGSNEVAEAEKIIAVLQGNHTPMILDWRY